MDKSPDWPAEIPDVGLVPTVPYDLRGSGHGGEERGTFCYAGSDAEVRFEDLFWLPYVSCPGEGRIKGKPISYYPSGRYCNSRN